MSQERSLADPYAPTDGPVAVIGAGVIGASWGAFLAAHGRVVRLHDLDPERLARGLAQARDQARFLTDHDLADPAQAETGLASLAGHGTLAEAVRDAAVVLECVAERYDVKDAVFSAADAHAPRHALLVTCTSGLSISRIQQAARYPDRCLAGHPYNPPHLIPLVEIAPGNQTAPEALTAAHAFFLSVGKAPVVLHREVPGYLANRMSAALWREAINLVLDGVATVDDVDRAIRLGPGLRWAVMGPHMLYHLGGGPGGIRHHVEHLRQAKEETWRDLAAWHVMPPGSADALEAGLPPLDQLAALADQRDQALLRVLRALEP
jgi:3-hydroxyacyl-CoA dehydrogenase